jgi:hypothetical protein
MSKLKMKAGLIAKSTFVQRSYKSEGLNVNWS